MREAIRLEYQKRNDDQSDRDFSDDFADEPIYEGRRQAALERR